MSTFNVDLHFKLFDCKLNDYFSKQQISSAFFLVHVTALSLLSFDEDEVGACAGGGEDGGGGGGVGEEVEFG